MVVHHADRLNERVDDGRSAELEAAPGQRLRERVGLLRLRRHVAGLPREVANRLAADERPRELGEAAELLLHLEERAGVRDRGRDLRAVPHDAGVGEQPADVRRAVARDFSWIKTLIGLAEM